MGCSFACFLISKNRKRRHPANVAHSEQEHQRNETSEAPQQVIESTKLEEDNLLQRSNETSEAPQQLIESTKLEEDNESKEKLEEEEEEESLNSNTSKKKVNFDFNVKTYDEEIIDNNNNLVKKINEEEKEEESQQEIIKLVSNSITITNNRYQNCVISDDDDDEVDDDYEDVDLEEEEESELDDGVGSDDEKTLVQEESSESLFSLSIESRKQVSEVELGEKEVTSSPMPISGNDDCVLSPIENLTQRKAVKARATPPPPMSNYEGKENFDFVQDPTFKVLACASKLNSDNTKLGDREMAAVDTSLSSWLVQSENTPMSKTSTISTGDSVSENAKSAGRHGDDNKPVLRALTVDEINQLSANRSRIRRSDKPRMGTVGSFWSRTGMIVDSDSGSSNSHGMPKTRSKNTEDERVKCHSFTPFEARLERALEIGPAEV